MGAHWHVIQVTHVDCTISPGTWTDSKENPLEFLPEALHSDFVLINKNEGEREVELKFRLKDEFFKGPIRDLVAELWDLVTASPDSDCYREDFAHMKKSGFLEKALPLLNFEPQNLNDVCEEIMEAANHYAFLTWESVPDLYVYDGFPFHGENIQFGLGGFHVLHSEGKMGESVDELFLLKRVLDKLQKDLAEVNPLAKHLYLMGY
jgi:hypothetical protein